MDSDDLKHREDPTEESNPGPSWVKVGAVAAVSALAGGLAAAWFYRRTLKRIQAAELEQEDSNFRTGNGAGDDI